MGSLYGTIGIMFCLIKIDKITTALDLLFPSIKFTIEKERGVDCPSWIVWSMYRKPTHTDRYLSF